MTNEKKKLELIHQLNTLSNKIEDSWPDITNAQVGRLEESIEALWQIVCRRKGGVK